MIRSIHHVQISIPRDAEDEARAFYSGVLGFREIAKPEELAGRGGFWLELGELQLHFGTEDDIERSKTKAHVAYLVDDLPGWRGKIEDLGLGVADSIPIPGFDRFEFRDPFGNRVEFLQRL